MSRASTGGLSQAATINTNTFTAANKPIIGAKFKASDRWVGGAYEILLADYTSDDLCTFDSVDDYVFVQSFEPNGRYDTKGATDITQHTIGVQKKPTLPAGAGEDGSSYIFEHLKMKLGVKDKGDNIISGEKSLKDYIEVSTPVYDAGEKKIPAADLSQPDSSLKLQIVITAGGICMTAQAVYFEGIRLILRLED